MQMSVYSGKVWVENYENMYVHGGVYICNNVVLHVYMLRLRTEMPA